MVKEQHVRRPIGKRETAIVLEVREVYQGAVGNGGVILSIAA